MRRLILFLFLLGTFFQGYPYAQNTIKLSGTILDSATNQPIEDVAVTVLGSHTGSYSDRDGRFALEGLLKGTHRVQFTHVKYQTITRRVIISGDTPVIITVHLSGRVYQSSLVTVEGTRTQGPVIRYTRDDIEHSQSSSVADLLEQSPNITITREGGSGTRSIRIRGSNTNQVLVLLDGVELNDPLTGEVNLDQIPAELVQKIRVQKYGGSAEYGSGAYAGVVSIESRSHAVDQWSTTGAIGSYGARELGSFLSGNPLSPFSYTIALNVRESANDFPYSYALPGGSEIQTTRENSDLAVQSIHSSLQWEKQQRTIRIAGHFLRSHRGLPGKIFQWTPYADAEDKRIGLSLAMDQQLPQSKLQLQTNISTSTSQYKNDPPEDAPDKYRIVPAYSTKYDQQFLKGGLRYEYRFSKAFRSTTGIEGSQSGFGQQGNSTDYAKPIQAMQQSYGMYAGSDFRLNGLPIPGFMTFSPQVRYSGIRIDDTNTTQTYPFCSASLDAAYHINGSQIFLNLNRSFRIPTFGDLFYQDFRVSGNPNVLPEKSKEGSAGFSSARFTGFNLRLTAEAYWRDFHDQIIWVTGSYGNFSPTNTDSRITGQSATLEWNYNDDRFFGYFSGEHLQPLNKNPNHALFNKILPFRSKYRGQIQFGTEFFGTRITYEHRIRGKRYITPANTKSLPAYDIDAIRFQRTFPVNWLSPRTDIRTSLLIENLWDAEYFIMERMPEPGRTYRLSLEFTVNTSQTQKE